MEFNDVVTVTNSSVFNDFKTAESKGRYYASNIRGKYKTQDTRIADTSVPR